MSEAREKPTWARLLDLIKTFFAWAGTAPPPTPPPLPPPEPVPAPPDTSGERLLARHNEYREANGRRVLSWNATLGTLAAKQANAMARAGTLSHEIAGTFQSRLSAQKSLKYRAAAENIAKAASLDAAFREWLKSPPHLASIMNANFTAMGAAVNTDGDTPGQYWCVVFLQEVGPGQFTTAGIVYTIPSGVYGAADDE